MNGKNLLEELVQRCRKAQAAGRMPVLVYDLDHTLFDNGPRTWQILLEFAETHGHKELRAALDELPHLGLPYLLSETLVRCGFEDEALHQAAFAFWRERFFTDEYQRFDLPLPGAIDFVNRLHDEGATSVYLSGRDAPGMLVGCAAALRHHRFPVGLARTSIILKHDFETPDLDFKREAVSYIRTLGEVVGTFDNEPGNCNLFYEAWPEAMNVYVQTACAPNPPRLLDGIATITDFADVT